MDYMVERAFLHEIALQCRQGMHAYNTAHELLSQGAGARSVMAAIDDVIDHASKVTLLLWPIEGQKTKDQVRIAANQRRAARGQHLREALEIGDDNILQNRQLRDHLHHFDERLDAWAAENCGFYIDGNIGPKDMFGIPGGSRACLRHYDPGSGIYSFRGEDFDIASIARAMSDMHDRALGRDAKRVKEYMAEMLARRAPSSA